MRTFVVAAAVLVGALALPANFDALPFAGATVSAGALQQEPAGPPPPPAQPAPSQPATQPAPSQPAQVNVEVQNPVWYASPTWVAIGAIGLVLLVVVVVMASRTEGNTVIRG